MSRWGKKLKWDFKDFICISFETWWQRAWGGFCRYFWWWCCTGFFFVCFCFCALFCFVGRKTFVSALVGLSLLCLAVLSEKQAPQVPEKPSHTGMNASSEEILLQVCLYQKQNWELLGVAKRVCLRQDALFTSGLIYVTNKVCFPGKTVNIWQGESQAFSLICFGKSEKWRSLHTLLHPKSRARSKYLKKIAVIIKHATMWWGPRRHGAVHTTLRTEVGGKGTENSRRRIWHFFWKSLKKKKARKHQLFNMKFQGFFPLEMGHLPTSLFEFLSCDIQGLDGQLCWRIKHTFILINCDQFLKPRGEKTQLLPTTSVSSFPARQMSHAEAGKLLTN